MTDPLLARITGVLRDTPARYPDDVARAVHAVVRPELERLGTELAALRAVARGYCPACGRGDAAPGVDDWEQQRQRADSAEAALVRVQALADEYPAGIDTALILEALDTGPAEAATQATHDPKEI